MKMNIADDDIRCPLFDLSELTTHPAFEQPAAAASATRKRPLAASATRKVRSEIWDKIPCLLCNRPYKTVAYLQKHMVAKHRICQPVVQVKCEFCGSVFADQEQFQAHAESSSRELVKNTGAVALLRQDQLEFSRVLRRLAREDAQEEEASKKKHTVEILEKFFDFSVPEDQPSVGPSEEDAS